MNETCSIVALNIEMSWKVYHKLVHSDKQEGDALLVCGSSIASPAAHKGPLGHRSERVCEHERDGPDF